MIFFAGFATIVISGSDPSARATYGEMTSVWVLGAPGQWGAPDTMSLRVRLDRHCYRANSKPTRHSVDGPETKPEAGRVGEVAHLILSVRRPNRGSQRSFFAARRGPRGTDVCSEALLCPHSPYRKSLTSSTSRSPTHSFTQSGLKEPFWRSLSSFLLAHRSRS